MNAICPNCGVIQAAVRQQIGGRLVFAAAGGALGSRALKNPRMALALEIVGYKLSLYLDEQISKWCPQWGEILRIMGPLGPHTLSQVIRHRRALQTNQSFRRNMCR
jgi:hypothetical protein